MKINKRRIPELFAGVLLLSIFIVPCAGVHADDFSEEQKEFIKSVVAEAIDEAGVVTKTELDGSLKNAVTEANKKSGSSASPSSEKLESVVLDAINKSGLKASSATNVDLSSVEIPAWIALGVSAVLGVVCLVFLILLMVRIPKKKDDDAEKAKRNADRDSYFNGLFKSVNDNTNEKNQKVLAAIGAIKAPTASEINVAVNNSVKPKFDALAGKIGEIKMPQSEEIATEVFGAVSKDLDNMKKFFGETKSYLEETKKVIGEVNQEYGGAVELLKKIQKDQKDHQEKMETDRKVFEQEKQKEKKELDEKRKGLDEREAGLVKRDADLVQANAALARKQDDLVAKEKTLDDEKKRLNARIKQAEENTRLECRSQFDKEKSVLEEKCRQEKTALEQKSAQEKAALEEKCKQEKAALAATIGELQKKVDGHNRELESYINQLKTAKAETDKLRSVNDTLNEEKQKLVADTQKLTSQLEEKDKQISSLKDENKKVWDEAKAKYDPQIQSLKAENDHLANDLGLEKKKTQENQIKIEELQGKNHAMQEENAKLASMLEAATRKFEELETENSHLREEIEHLRAENQRLQTELSTALSSIQKSEKIIYPEEFKSNPKFAVLKQHLDEWMDIPESAIVRASLQLFSQRATLKKEDTISLALRDLSFGITQTLSRKNVAPNEIIAELVSWCDFIQGYSDDNFKFNLQVPGLGENYDSTRMTTTKSTDRVHKVLSWMVVIHRKSANPIKKLAEVE